MSIARDDAALRQSLLGIVTAVDGVNIGCHLALLVADDVGDKIWRVTAAKQVLP